MPGYTQKEGDKAVYREQREMGLFIGLERRQERLGRKIVGNFRGPSFLDILYLDGQSL